MKLTIGPVKELSLRKTAIIFLSISLNMCFGCSKEPSHRDGSSEYSQHMIRKIIFSYILLSGVLIQANYLTFNISILKYQYLT